jgi:hypothetical protein
MPDFCSSGSAAPPAPRKTNFAVVDRSSPLLVSFTSSRQRPPGSRPMPVT